MYHEKIVIENLEAFARQEGWMPEYHTIAQVEEFKAYIEKLTQSERTSRSMNIEIRQEISTKRAKDIRRWVENEQVLCMFDSNYFESRYAWVCDEKGDIFKFKNRKGQEVFDNVIAEFDLAQTSIELLILKARQLGITTKTALKFLQRLLFMPHTQAVMGSVKDDKSELISRIIETCIERLPWWLIPQRTTDRIKMIGFNNGSVMSVQSGSQATGIAQGWTPTCVHLSEIGDILNPKKTIEEGLLRATHSSRKLFMVLEGTGNGNVGWQADKWRACKEDWPLGRSRLCPVFINWPMAPDLYPEADWLRKFPVPAGFKPIEATRKHVQRCELYIRNTPYLARVVGKMWKMPIEQQWFWEFNYLDAVKTHSQKIWLSQMPADDYEALQGKHDMVFDPIVIDTTKKNRQMNYQAYAITGDSIDDGLEVDENEIDYNKDFIRVYWTSHRGQKFEWVMKPLKPFDEEDERASHDKLLVFEEPNMCPGEEGEAQDYSIGVDNADGLGNEDEERSAGIVTRNMADEKCDVQVAEFCSNRINAPQMVGFLACIASWYGANNKDGRGVKFCIEQRDRPGDDCQLQLKLMGFNYHHIDTRYDSKSVKENAGHKQGWYSNAWSVPMLMNRYIDAVNGGWYKCNSPFLINENSTLERQIKTGKSKMVHQSGKFDDRVRAAAQSYFTRHAFDILAERSQRRYMPPAHKLPEIDRAYSTLSEINIGGWE